MIGNVLISEVGCSYVCCTKQDRKHVPYTELIVGATECITL